MSATPSETSTPGMDRCYPASRSTKGKSVFELVRFDGHRRLAVATASGAHPEGLEIDRTVDGGRTALCPLSAKNAAWMRGR